MNLLEVKKATVKVEAIMRLIHEANCKQLAAMVKSRDSQCRAADQTAEADAYDKGWSDGVGAASHCFRVEIQDLDAAEVIEALNRSEDD